ncbi:MAG TPA: hypothetical protein VMJ72_00115 [Candidatus Paceibacterota bacterium]|nr:hypothetical protein [Candidatus Paceibacterota bacterium]
MAEGNDKPEAFLGHRERRAAEQTWLQERGNRDQAAEQRIFEYSKLLPVMTQHVRDLDSRMLEMRAAGIPDATAYDAVRKELSDLYKKLTALHEEIGKIADGIAGTSPSVTKHAREVQDSLHRPFEAMEDAFKFALGSHDLWVKEHAAREGMRYGKREADHGEFHKRLMPAELYDEEVMKLQEMVAGWETNVELLVRKHKLTPDVVDDVQRTLDDVQEKLQELDAETFDPADSRERRSLMHMINQLRTRLVKGAYAAVAHELAEPQRREMRSYLARLTALMNRDASKSSDASLKVRIRLAVNRANTTAPKLAAAVFRPEPKLRP